ncbi:MAG: hypothetical protein ACRDUY_01255 [Nitriliruptorales bacterium]
MQRIPSPKDLNAAASVAQTLAYAAGLAGVVAGGLLHRGGETGFAVVAWVLTFAVGAILMVAAFLARGMAALLARIARIEQDVATLLSKGLAEEHERDPWSRHPPPY